MKGFIKALRLLFLLILFNAVSICGILRKVPAALIVVMGTALIHGIYFIVRPQKKPVCAERRLVTLSNGACILGYGILLFLLEIPAWLILMIFDQNPERIIWDIIPAFFFILIVVISGLIRTAVGARQHRTANYILLFLTWYLPFINVIAPVRIYRQAKREFNFEQARHELDDMRAENQICRTKYPIVMVHGIFFRDWQLLNYWGRIPKALAKNGADVSYASQQSAASIHQSAGEIASHIENVIKMTGAEKVNIIAHSKGGLDSRYAISRLGMDKYVASLTTINTPHRGCKWADNALEKCPQGIKRFVSDKYNSLFKKLGDTWPDFMAGVEELTASSCEKFNREVPDMPGIKYTSIMSRMVSPKSAGFPLNIGWFLAKKDSAKGNDGLVGVDSALYWEDSRMIPDTKKRGISHGDMIDLMRENIEDFDVREFYVQLVRELKEQGY